MSGAEQLTFGSLFAGIGGFDFGLERAVMRCVFQVEQNADCLKVLGKHWPDVPKFTDVREFDETSIAVRPDWICGGFPCQDLSVAGRRAGLGGERSGLFFEFMRIVEQFAPRGVLIENVPGLLSSNGGCDMGTVLGTLGQLGYGFAYRVLDAQWFGVAQRRRRVFIVGCAGGDVRRAAEILFERESLPWDSAPSREAGTRVAYAVAAGAGGSKFGSGRDGQDTFVTGSLKLHQGGADDNRAQANHLVAHTLRAEGFDASEDGTGRGTPIVPVAFSGKDHGADAGEIAPTLRSMGHDKSHANGGGQVAIAYQCHGSNVGPMGTLRSGNGNESGSVPFVSDVAYCLTDARGTGDGHGQGWNSNYVGERMAVRRLLPVECERLQGFSDGHTQYGSGGEEISDSARYRMLGNAVCVNVAEWIGRRIVEQQPTKQAKKARG